MLTAAQALGVDLDSVCGGRGLCGRCQIMLAEGKFAKHGIHSDATHLSPADAVEARYAARRPMAHGRRLGCQALIRGDAVIDIPADSQVHRQVVRKRAEARAVRVDPVLRLHYVTVEEPDMHRASGDLQRLKTALAEQWGLDELAVNPGVLRDLQSVLRKGQWSVTAAVRDGREIVAIWPGFHDRALGLAVDIGSTTIAAHLCDLASGDVLASAGAMNPQIRFGEDLMSRVSYVMLNPGSTPELSGAVRTAVAALSRDVAREAGAEASDILEAVLVGNPVMHHLLLGLDPIELGGAPFALATDEALNLPADTLDLAGAMHSQARCYVLPCIAGHVGADCAAVVLSEGPHLSDDVHLIVDVGTNAEIVLGNRERLLAASSPTGPAFEGAQISAGQRAAPGAIERVRIDRVTLEPRFKVIGADQWSDEPGFGQATAAIGTTGICGSGIIEVLAELFLAGALTADGRIDGTAAARSARIRADGRTFAYLLAEGPPEILVTQGDVRAIQLAKAALHAGAQLLMDRLGVETVDRITLAGAFGSHIDVTYAMVLGLLPDCPLDKVSSAGNAAGTGARIALVNAAARREIESVVRQIEKIETAVEPTFQAHFVAAMGIPHKSAEFPNLATVIDLPPRSGDDTSGPARRRRRRPA